MSVDKIRTQIAMTGPATYERESSWWKRSGVINASETEYGDNTGVGIKWELGAPNSPRIL